MTWGPGRDRIADLITSTELESVTADEGLAARLLVDSARHLETARSAVDLGDLTGAYQLAYDALRKAAAALLAVQGLRSTSRGGHIAIQDAVQAQFGGAGSPFRALAGSGAVATLSSIRTPTPRVRTARTSRRPLLSPRTRSELREPSWRPVT